MKLYLVRNGIAVGVFAEIGETVWRDTYVPGVGWTAGREYRRLEDVGGIHKLVDVTAEVTAQMEEEMAIIAEREGL